MLGFSLPRRAVHAMTRTHRRTSRSARYCHCSAGRCRRLVVTVEKGPLEVRVVGPLLQRDQRHGEVVEPVAEAAVVEVDRVDAGACGRGSWPGGDRRGPAPGCCWSRRGPAGVRRGEPGPGRVVPTGPCSRGASNGEPQNSSLCRRPIRSHRGRWKPRSGREAVGMVVKVGQQVPDESELLLGESGVEEAARHPGQQGAQARLGHQMVRCLAERLAVAGRLGLGHGQVGVCAQRNQPLEFGADRRVALVAVTMDPQDEPPAPVVVDPEGGVLAVPQRRQRCATEVPVFVERVDGQVPHATELAAGAECDELVVGHLAHWFVSSSRPAAGTPPWTSVPFTTLALGGT